MDNRPSIASAILRVAAGACVLLVGLILPSGAAAQSTPASPGTRTPATERDSAAPSSREQDPQQADAKQKEEARRSRTTRSDSDGRAIHRCSSAKERTSIFARAFSSMRGADSPGERFRRAGNRLRAPANRGRRRDRRRAWHSRSIGELEGENAWRDVYANYQQFDFVQVQGGKFKLPFSLDENTSPTNLDFVYRSLAARVLAPGRDRGVMVHGRAARSNRPLRAGRLRS